MTDIVLRFVTGKSWTSSLIRLQAGVCMPFTPSHVEALTPDGQFYIGAHIDGGIQKRPVGYDKADLFQLLDGSKTERLISLHVTIEQYTAFHGFCASNLEEPYDWEAIFSFALLGSNYHLPSHLFCSAFMADGLRSCKYFPWPLTVPFHHISPRDLFLILSAHVEISH